MQYTRREAATIFGGLGLSTTGISRASAQSFATQDVRFVCAFAAGSGADIIVRYFAEKMRPKLGRTVIVENRAGAGGNIAVEYVARSKPDGHTVLVHSGNAIAANMHLYKNPPVDVLRALQLVATINKQAYMLAVAASKPWKNVAELTAHLQQRGDKASYGTANPPTAVMGEQYKLITGVKAVQVAYKSGPDALNDTLGGTLDYVMLDPVLALAQARENKLRILAVSTKERISAVPDIPSMHESGVTGMDILGWWSAQVPAATQRPIVDQLGQMFSEVVASPDAKEFLNRVGGDPYVNSPDAAQKILVDDVKNWGDYVRLAKIEPQG
jgi:tripartite-type tricarboxylate transporter receptor subunit TctC